MPKHYKGVTLFEGHTYPFPQEDELQFVTVLDVLGLVMHSSVHGRAVVMIGKDRVPLTGFRIDRDEYGDKLVLLTQKDEG